MNNGNMYNNRQLFFWALTFFAIGSILTFFINSVISTNSIEYKIDLGHVINNVTRDSAQVVPTNPLTKKIELSIDSLEIVRLEKKLNNKLSQDILQSAISKNTIEIMLRNGVIVIAILTTLFTVFTFIIQYQSSKVLDIKNDMDKKFAEIATHYSELSDGIKKDLKELERGRIISDEISKYNNETLDKIADEKRFLTAEIFYSLNSIIPENARIELYNVIDIIDLMNFKNALIAVMNLKVKGNKNALPYLNSALGYYQSLKFQDKRDEQKRVEIIANINSTIDDIVSRNNMDDKQS